MPKHPEFPVISLGDWFDQKPGVGKKVAERIILEIKDKIAAGWVTAPAVEFAEANTDVLAALTALGYSASEASRAVASLPADAELPLEERVRLALQYFGGSR